MLRVFVLPPFQTLITAVSQCGVDINAMVANPWRQGPLQFVPGLGPRKARALLAAIAASEDPFVKTRVDLLKQVHTVSSRAALPVSLLPRKRQRQLCSLLTVTPEVSVRNMPGGLYMMQQCW